MACQMCDGDGCGICCPPPPDPRYCVNCGIQFATTCPQCGGFISTHVTTLLQIVESINRVAASQSDVCSLSRDACGTLSRAIAQWRKV
jgi:hypothetical protein